ncbi:alpha/beta hydrolase family protein, partial [Streptobacillus moniliformis]|uniref:alpha/beta hydrolase family protein n=1 Tax=Streptobacillus moniliformis TaxID=34105 RepID=UPI0012DB2215
ADYLGAVPPGYASPINAVSANDPPTLLQHGNQDVFVEGWQAYRMSAALSANRVPNSLKIYTAGHNLLDPAVSAAFPDMLAFTRRVTG